jgi:hypothetical protein
MAARSVSVLFPLKSERMTLKSPWGVFPGRWAVVFFEQVGVLDAVTSVRVHLSQGFRTISFAISDRRDRRQRCAKSLRPSGSDACDGSTSPE